MRHCEANPLPPPTKKSACCKINWMFDQYYLIHISYKKLNIRLVIPTINFRSKKFHQFCTPFALMPVYLTFHETHQQDSHPHQTDILTFTFKNKWNAPSYSLVQFGNSATVSTRVYLDLHVFPLYTSVFDLLCRS